MSLVPSLDCSVMDPPIGISLNSSGLSMGVFEQAVSNVAYLRAQAGGGMSRLNFASESISSMETNRSAIGRIKDVDIAAESRQTSSSTQY